VHCPPGFRRLQSLADGGERAIESRDEASTFAWCVNIKYLTEVAHDQALVWGRGDPLEELREEQVEKDVPELPLVRVRRPVQPNSELIPIHQVRQRCLVPTDHRSDEHGQLAPVKPVVRSASRSYA